MAINGVKPGSQGIEEASNIVVSEPKVIEVEQVRIPTTTDNIGEKNTQVANASIEDQQLTQEQLDKKLKDAISMANNKLKQAQPNTRCEFTYHEDVNRVSIKLVDKDTKNVVKEIPTEKTIKMLEKLWEVAGLLVDEKL